jgi:glycosyltransferase involved in cell wall biosynthesis
VTRVDAGRLNALQVSSHGGYLLVSNNPAHAKRGAKTLGQHCGRNNKMKLLMISPVPTDLPTAGNRVRVLNLLTALERLGHDVTFAYVPYEHGDVDYMAMETRLGHRLRVLQSNRPPFPSSVGRFKRKIRRALKLPSAHLWDVDEWFDDALLSQVKKLQIAENFETVLIEYVFLSKVVSVLPKTVRTVIDTHDLMGNRHKHYLKFGLNPTWFMTTPGEEIHALSRATATIAIQSEEAGYLRRHVCGDVFCVGHVSAQEIIPLEDPGGSGMLFVGSANPINIHGLEWFVESMLPRVRAAIPSCELSIAGPAGQVRSWPKGVKVCGPVESLVSEYAKAALVINPVIFGTGLAIKTIEALSYGKALVVTAAGARGLGVEFSAAMSIAEDSNTFAQQIIELLRNKAARIKLSQNAVAAIRAWRLQQLVALDASVKGSK